MSHSLDPPALTVRAFDTATVLAFVVALCVPLCVMLFGSMQDISTVEQRMLAAWPPLPEDARALRRFPRRVERAFTDHLGLRLELTRAQAALEAVLFATSPTSKIVVGRDGWLFFGDADAMGHARHVQPLGPHALARWADVLEARRIWLRRHGAEFLFVLVPDKHHVYSEHLPRGIVAAGGTHPIEQLSTELARRGSVPTLDLLPILEAAKPDDLLYHKTDTHWNDRGAYIAYAAILEAAGRLVPELADDTPVADDPARPAFWPAVASDGAGNTLIAYERHPATTDKPAQIACRVFRP